MLTKYRLLFIISMLLLIGFFLTSFLSYKVAVNLTKDELKYKSLPLSSDNIYSEIQRDLLKPNLVSSLMAQDTFVRNWVLSGEKDIEEIKNYLDSIQKKYKTSSSFFVSNKTKNYYYPKGILKKVSASNERDIWFFRVKNIVDEFECNIDIDMAANDSLTIFTNYRVYDFSGNFIGVTGVGLKTSHVSTLLETYKSKYNHDIYFVKPSNEIVLSTKDFSNELRINQKTLMLLIEDYNKKSISSLEYTVNSEKYFVNLRYIDELNLYLFVEAKEKFFTQELKENFYINIIISLCIMLLIIGAVMWNINYYQGKLERLAKKDKLTALPNRNDFDIKFDRIFNSSRKDEHELTLILFDVDNFKEVNDNFGHLVGDKVLIEVAKIFRATFRRNDIIARWGGEEFIALLSNSDKDIAFKVAEKLRHEIESSTTIKEIIGRTLTVSVGVAIREESENKETFFTRVDNNLYQAKEEGKNKTVIL